IGLLFKDEIEEIFGWVRRVGVAVVFRGVGVWVIGKVGGGKVDNELWLKEAVMVGLGEGVGVIGGMRRSGSRVIRWMGVGMKEETGVGFWFMV
uniref:undecaprenyl-diphosphate phosphatase n=1 Tax=Geobacillus sp. (strain Y412MC10) TaxID=481743 RepID=UPI0028CBB54C